MPYLTRAYTSWLSFGCWAVIETQARSSATFVLGVERLQRTPLSVAAYGYLDVLIFFLRFPPLTELRAHPPPLAITEELRTLKYKYKIAYEAYRSCVEALTKASSNGDRPSADLLEREAKSLRVLTEARRKLLAAMAGS